MRYTCPSCKRVFYLETKTQSPCPACGTMLQSEDAAGASGAAEAVSQPKAVSQAAEDIWSAAAKPAEKEEDLWQPAAPAQPTEELAQPKPSASSWFQTGAATSSGQPSYILQEKPSARLTTAAPVSPAPAPATEATETPPAPEEAPHLAQTGPLMAAGRGLSGARLFIITGTAVIVSAAAAVLLVMLIKPKFVVAPTHTDQQPAAVGALEQEMSKLRKELNTKRDELAKLQAELLEERRSATTKLEQLQKELQGFRDGFLQRSEAAALVLEAAALLERRADLAEALNKVSSAIKADPTFVSAYRLKGRVLAASGRAEEALKAFEEADKVAKAIGAEGDPEALILAGELCLTDVADRSRAADFFKRAAETKPGSPVALAAEARLLFLEGKLDEAAAKAEGAMKASPTLAVAPLILGEIAFEKAMRLPAAERRASLAKADEMLALAIKLDPASARGNLVRGRLLLEDAKLIAGAPSFSLPRLGRQSQAERALSRAMELSPNWADVHMALAELRLSEGALKDPVVAVARAKEAVRLSDNKNARAFAVLAAAHAASGNPPLALQSIREALKLDPQNPEYREALRRYEADAQAVR